jgi:hypothetical protein
MQTHDSTELNIDAAALEQFEAYLKANEEAQASALAAFVSHNSNNDARA